MWLLVLVMRCICGIAGVVRCVDCAESLMQVHVCV
jgi:hypothetical protein